jgi:ribose transport system permease protein
MSGEIDSVLDATLSAPPPPRLGRKSWIGRVFGHRAVIMLVINLAFILIMTRLSPYFLYAGNGFANFKVMLVSMAMDTIVLAAMVMLLIGGMFDLSVDGVVNMTGVVTGALLVSGANIWLAMAAGAASALIVGLINGFAVTWLKMNPLMTTLGTWWIAQGLAFGITQGISSHSFPQEFIDIGYSSPWGITMPIWYACFLVALAIWVLAKTRFGYHIYAIGGNREGARLHGVKVNRVTIISFVLVALASALSGIVYAARLNAAVPQTVNGLNLRVISGAVIGGCSLNGGEGSIVGALLGLFFMTMLTNASIMLNISPYWQMCILGVVVLIAVGADAFAKRRIPAA